MGKYRKDFAGWAKVAEMLEDRERKVDVKPGVIFWAHVGVGVGLEEVGKGEEFTRPVLVLERLNQRIVLAIPITSQKKEGANCREIVVAGKIEYLLFDQLRTIDVKCLEQVIDEVDSVTLKKLRGDLLRILKYHFYS